MKKAIFAAAVVTAAVLSACSDSAGGRSVTGPTTLAPGGTVGAEALTHATAQGVSGPPEGVSAVRPATLTFDDITSASTAAIPNGYGVLDWTHFSVVDPIAYGQSESADCTPGHPSNGYVNGTISPKYVAYPPGGGPGEVTAKGRTFNFISAYFTAANDKLMMVSGYKNGALRYSRTFPINCDGPVLFEANFMGVDRVVIDSRGGTAGYSTLGDTFAMDNFTYDQTATPPQSGLQFLGAGLAAK